MEILTRNLTGSPTLTIDCIRLLNSLGLSKAELKAYIPIVKRDSVKQEIGWKVIDAIIDRTKEGYDKEGRSFVPYSKSYRDSLIFKIYKAGKRKPDLHLTGAMQSDIAVLSTNTSAVTIGFTDYDEAQKAKGHILGANYLPVRDFFGMKKTDLQTIVFDAIKEYEDEAQSMLEITSQDVGGIELSTEGFQDITLEEGFD